jgi:signal transduction histidine kinase
MKRRTVAGGHAGAVAGLPGSPAIRPLAAAGPTWSSGFRMAAGCLVVLLVVGGMHAAGREISALSGAAAEGGVFFPAAGVTFAALVLLPRRLWPLVLAATFCGQLGVGVGLGVAGPAAVGAATASAVGPLAGAAAVLARTGGLPVLSRRRHLTAFAWGAAIVGAGLGALVRALATLVTGQDAPFVTVLARWWTSDGLGVLIVGGLLVAWLADSSSPIRPRYRRLEAVALGVSAALLAWLAFWDWQPGLTYLCLLPLGWAALRFGARGATTVAAVLAVAGEWGTVTDHGMFATVTSHDDIRAVWLLQLFLAIAVLAGLMLASQVAELSRAEASLRDSERAEAEARLAAREAKAAERSRLARELHDSVSQALFSIAAHARTAQLALAQIPQAAGGPLGRAVGQLRELSGGALAEMRALIFELRPEALAEEGLVAALSRQAAAISAREQLPVAVDGPQERLVLSAGAEENAYRIVLEALHNAVKHANASHVTIAIAADGQQGARISVTDDGAGFDPGAVGPGHLGLRTMAERAAVIGAGLDLVSSPGAGTRVQLTLPAGADIGPPGDDVG